MSGLQAAAPTTRSALDRLGWPLAVFGLALLLRSPIFFYPFFNGDEATYSALANALLDGQTLYVGAVDHKPPGIAATYALLLALFGRQGLHGVHLVSILVAAATALLVGRAGTLSGLSRLEARLATLACLVFSFIGPGKDMLAANAELFMLLPSTLAVVVFLAGRREGGSAAVRLATALAAGLLAGLAFLYKYQGGAIAGTLVGVALLDRRGRSWGAALAEATALGLGTLAPTAALAGAYALAGHLADLHFWAWTYPLRYAGKLGPGEMLRNGLLGTGTWAGPSLALLVAATLGAESAWRGGVAPRRPALLVLAGLWLLGGCSGVVAGGRFFLHYYLQLVPPLALLAGPWLAAVWQRRALPGRPGRALLAALVALPLLLSWGADAADHALRPRVPRYTRIYQAVGARCATMTVPGETLFVWGNSPEIYHFSGRSMGTRFPFCNYHSGKIWGTPADEEGARPGQEQRVTEAWPLLLDDLTQRRPAGIVDAAAGGLDRWAGHELRHYPELWRIVERDYRPVAEVQGVRLYLRRDLRPAPASTGRAPFPGADSKTASGAAPPPAR